MAMPSAVLEKRAAASCVGGAFELMQRAGQAAWRSLLEHWPQAQRIVVACGPGNNGGDGYVLAALAHRSGRDVRVVRLERAARRLAQRACEEYLAAGGQAEQFHGRRPWAAKKYYWLDYVLLIGNRQRAVERFGMAARGQVVLACALREFAARRSNRTTRTSRPDRCASAART